MILPRKVLCSGNLKFTVHNQSNIAVNKTLGHQDLRCWVLLSKVELFLFRIAVNFAGSPVELNFKRADKDLPQPLLCKRKGAVVDVLV